MPRISTINETRSPAPALVDYYKGKMEYREANTYYVSGFVSILFSFLFFQLAAALWPKPFQEWNGFQGVGLFGALFVGFLMVALGTYMLTLPLRRERKHEKRRDLAFAQDIESRAAGNDVIVETEASVYDFDADNFLHMLGLVVMIWFLNKERKMNGAPWAVRNMIGNMMIGRVGAQLNISEGQAREARKLIGAYGIVQDDGIEKSAGRLAPQTLEEAVRLLSDKWNRVTVEGD